MLHARTLGNKAHTSSAKQTSRSWAWQHFSRKLEKSAVTASYCSSVMLGFCFTTLMRSLGFKTKGKGESVVHWHFPNMLFLVDRFLSPGSPTLSHHSLLSSLSDFTLTFLIRKTEAQNVPRCWPPLVQVTDETLCQDPPCFYGVNCDRCLAYVHYPFFSPLLQCALSMHTSPDV